MTVRSSSSPFNPDAGDTMATATSHPHVASPLAHLRPPTPTSPPPLVGGWFLDCKAEL